MLLFSVISVYIALIKILSQSLSTHTPTRGRGGTSRRKKPLLPRRVQGSLSSARCTQHMWELLAENRTAVLLGHARGRWSMSYHWSKQGAHIHHYLTHAHSHYQWQLWTAVSPLLGLTLSYSVLSCRGEFFKCQLHTTHVGAVDWEPHGSSPTICAGNADHGFGVCVPLALICLLKIVNLTVLLH